MKAYIAIHFTYHNGLLLSCIHSRVMPDCQLTDGLAIMFSIRKYLPFLQVGAHEACTPAWTQPVSESECTDTLGQVSTALITRAYPAWAGAQTYLVCVGSSLSYTVSSVTWSLAPLLMT